MFFDDPMAENRGYYGLDPLTVFKRTHAGGFSNGQLFTLKDISDERLKEMVLNISQSPEACPVDVAPDYGAGAVPLQQKDFVGRVVTGPDGELVPEK